MGTQVLSVWHRLAGTPAGTQLSMAASSFVQEMCLVGERLLLKLRRLPQAEPVEIVAFSVILLFTGQLGLSAPVAPPGIQEMGPQCWPEGWGRRLGVPQAEEEKQMSLGRNQGISPSSLTCRSSDGVVLETRGTPGTQPEGEGNRVLGGGGSTAAGGQGPGGRHANGQ